MHKATLLALLLATPSFAIEPAPENRVEIKVTEAGFEPREVRLRRGEPVTLVFLRTTDRTCITAIDIPVENVKKLELPLHRSVTLTFTPLGGFTGQISLYCYVTNGYPGAVVCSPQSQLVNVTGSSAVTATLTFTTFGASSQTTPRLHWRLPLVFRARPLWPPLLTAILALAVLMAFVRMRAFRVLWLLPGALVAAGIWVACGGGGAGGGGGGGGGPPPAPDVSLSPGLVNFATQNVGVCSSSQAIMLFNSGEGLLSISNLTIGGTDPKDFAQTNTCGNSVGAGDKCFITVTFTPTLGGTRTASILLSDNAADSPQSVALTGTGYQPALALSPNSVAFGAVQVGASSAPQSVLVLNTSPSSVSIYSIWPWGGGVFSQTNNCPGTLASGAKCTINMTFSPVQGGINNGTLTVNDNVDPTSPTATLTGTGATPPGTYTVEVTAGSIAAGAGVAYHTANASVTVQ